MKKKILLGIVAITIIASNVEGSILLGLYQRMKLTKPSVKVCETGCCNTVDGFTLTDVTSVSTENTSISLDSLSLALRIDDKKELIIAGDEKAQAQGNDLCFRKYIGNSRNQYIQVYAKAYGTIIISSYQGGKYSNVVYYKVNLTDSLSAELYSKFLSCKKLRSLPSSRTQESNEEKLRKIENEINDYDKLINDSISAPKFGLG